MIDRVVIDRTRTDRFLGECTKCTRPLALEKTDVVGTYTYGECPECTGRIKLTRLTAVTTMEVCDGRCMGAAGPACSCACGGANHGRAFGPTATHYERETALKNHRKKVAQRKATATETKKAKALRLYGEWYDGLTDEDQALIDWLLVWENVADNGFLIDMRLYVLRASKGDSKYPGQPLTERQFAAVRRIHTRELERAARDAEEAANARPVPTGKALTVEGEIVHVRYEDNLFGPGGSYKMLVMGDGWKVWSTVPQSLLPSFYNMVELDQHLTGMKGARVRFVADVELQTRKNDPEFVPDPSFGVAKRPRRAERLAA